MKQLEITGRCLLTDSVGYYLPVVARINYGSHTEVVTADGIVHQICPDLPAASASLNHGVGFMRVWKEVAGGTSSRFYPTNKYFERMKREPDREVAS